MKLDARLVLKFMAGLVAISGLAAIASVSRDSGAVVWAEAAKMVLSLAAAPLLWIASRPVSPSRALVGTAIAAVVGRALADLAASIAILDSTGRNSFLGVAITLVITAYAVQCLLDVAKSAPDPA